MRASLTYNNLGIQDPSRRCAEFDLSGANPGKNFPFPRRWPARSPATFERGPPSASINGCNTGGPHAKGGPCQQAGILSATNMQNRRQSYSSGQFSSAFLRKSACDGGADFPMTSYAVVPQACQDSVFQYYDPTTWAVKVQYKIE